MLLSLRGQMHSTFELSFNSVLHFIINVCCVYQSIVYIFLLLYIIIIDYNIKLDVMLWRIRLTSISLSHHIILCYASQNFFFLLFFLLCSKGRTRKSKSNVVKKKRKKRRRKRHSLLGSSINIFFYISHRIKLII